MKEFGQLDLADSEVGALARLKRDLSARYPLVDIVVFGSRVRGDSDFESDLDVLVVLSVPRSHRVRAEVSDVVFEINLDLGTNISALVVGSTEWFDGRLLRSPIKKNVDKEGISIW
ncbi:MAG: nucleotidyltransferase domain-containing protein [Bacillota bacterium]